MYKIEDEDKIQALAMYRKGTYGVEDTPYRNHFVEGQNFIDFDNVYDSKCKLRFEIRKHNENFLIGFCNINYDLWDLINLVELNFNKKELMQNFNSHNYNNYNKKLIENFKEEEREEVIGYISAEITSVWLYAKQEKVDIMITKLKDFLLENKLITGVKENA
jgi:hypothetical protein